MQYIQKIGYRTQSMVQVKIESIEYYPFHLHDDSLEIICVLNGRIKISDSAASYYLSYGDIHIFNKNDPHKIEAVDSDNIVLTAHINTDHYQKSIEELRDAYFISDTNTDEDVYSVDNTYLRFMLARLYKAYANEASSFILEEYVTGILSLLIEQYQNYIYKEDENKKANIVRLINADYIYKNYERMYRIVDYVCYHFREKLTLEMIAEQEYLTKAYLSQYIKDTLGLTFTQLLSLTRCEEAARLLSSTHKTVDQIAVEVGFANRKHLAVQFKRWYDRTPSEYRNDILKDLSADIKVKLRPFDFEFSQTIIDMYLNEY